MTETWTIRRATPDDAAALADFARDAFNEFFGALSPPEDTAAYLAGSFGTDIQRAEIERDDAAVLIVESTGELAGYAPIEVGPAPSVELRRPVQLHRLYLLGRMHGSGAATALMSAAQDAARDLGGESMWLSVWDQNERAIAFYRKSGFAVVGSAEFVVGADVQSDHLMAMTLSRSAGTSIP